VDPVLERFFLDEVDDHVAKVLLQDADARTTGEVYRTFNVFNVRLDFDASTATVEDELDPELEETVELRGFLDRLREHGAPSR
jgi:hypothetical protein